MVSGTPHIAPDSNPGGASDTYDIAVIVLDQAMSTVPARLPRTDLLGELKASHDLRDQTFTTVGYGQVREARKGGPDALLKPPDVVRRFALQSNLSLEDAWLTLSMNEATGDGGACYGDSGGPHFLGGEESDLVVSVTVQGDRVCKATDKTYRIDTPSAREFLQQFVELP